MVVVKGVGAGGIGGMSVKILMPVTADLLQPHGAQTSRSTLYSFFKPAALTVRTQITGLYEFTPFIH